jgi:hypothetical protein
MTQGAQTGGVLVDGFLASVGERATDSDSIGPRAGQLTDPFTDFAETSPLEPSASGNVHGQASR